jgi:hypothetical protein
MSDYVDFDAIEENSAPRSGSEDPSAPPYDPWDKSVHLRKAVKTPGIPPDEQQTKSCGFCCKAWLPGRKAFHSTCTPCTLGTDCPFCDNPLFHLRAIPKGRGRRGKTDRKETVYGRELATIETPEGGVFAAIDGKADPNTVPLGIHVTHQRKC